MRSSAARVLALLLSTAAANVSVADEARTAPTRVEKTFLIPSSEGYGVGDCLTSRTSACGQVVADAWCEAQGFASAATFGVAAPDDVTGAIDAPIPTKTAERPIRITCQD